MTIVSSRFAWYVVTLATCCVLSSAARAEAAAPTSTQSFAIDAVRADTPPIIDGTLNDAAWKQAAHARLDWDYSFQRPAKETTDVYLLFDQRNLYVAFDARQSVPITTTLHTNNVVLAADDVVRIYLWPGGDQGFEYIFAATPIGTRNQVSTENTAFSPSWTAVGKNTPGGYVVTMKIPLNVMRGDGRKTWRLQFDRHITATSQTFEWSHLPSQRSTDDVTGIGFLSGMRVSSNTRTKPRLGVYALGQSGAASAGGTTSRMGADFAFPITPTASVFGTLHPDYSNVELDQQTISPTAFPRQLQEVRPFFTQGANAYNNFNGNDMPAFPLLYTPAIPTPRDGFATEGVEGRLQFAGFDAIGAGRTDTAQSLLFVTADRRLRVTGLRESVSLPGFYDTMLLGQVAVGNAHNFSTYLTLSEDRGTNVVNTALGGMTEFGLNLYTSRSGIFAAYHHNGALYSPFDALVGLTDVTGPSVYAFKEWDYSPSSFIQSVKIQQDVQRFHNRFDQLDYTNDGSFFTLTTRNKFTLNLSSGAQWLLLPSATGVFINQSGVQLQYGQATTTPTSISFNMGRFGEGFLRTWARSTTLKAGQRGTMTFEVDDTNFAPDTGGRQVQWLERASYAYQITNDSSLALGARKIVGIAPPLTPEPRVVNATNLTVAYYRKFGPNELYLVYGDPSSLATKPALVLKYIRYIGAEKGA